MARGSARGVGAFGDSAILILTSLAEGDKHGYALIKDIEHFSGVTVGPGTLYGALARLEERGLVEALPEQNRRRPFRITSAGAAVLETEVESIRRVATAGHERLRFLRARHA